MALNKQLAWGILLPTVVAGSVIAASAYILVSSENKNLKQENIFLSNEISALKTKVTQKESVNVSDGQLPFKTISENGVVTITVGDKQFTFKDEKGLFVENKEANEAAKKSGSGSLSYTIFGLGVIQFSQVLPVDQNELDGKCDGIGDLDCAAFNLQKQQDLFAKVIAGKGKFGLYGETAVLSEKVVTMNAIPTSDETRYLSAVTFSPNGECSLLYVTFVQGVKIQLAADICSAKTVPPKLDISKLTASDKAWALSVIDGTTEQGDFDVYGARLGMRGFLQTMKVQ